MNAVSKVLACGLLGWAFCPWAWAECQVSLSQSTVNYGQIKHGDLSQNVRPWSTLAERTVQLNAWCPQSEKMALFFGGKAGEQQVFLFGENSRLVVTASHGMLDGKSVQLNQTASHGSFLPAGQSSDELMVRNGQGIIPVNSGEALAGQQFSLTLTLKPALNNSDLNIHDKHKLDSSLQIQLETE